jgi:hypothetical protein
MSVLIKKENLASVLKEAESIRFSKELENFIDSIVDFLLNYLPLENSNIKALLMVSFNRLHKLKQISLEEIDPNAIEKNFKILQRCAPSLKNDIRKIFENQDPLINAAIDGFIYKFNA